MNSSKNFLMSKTYQGIIVMLLVRLLSFLLPKLGIQLPDAELTGIAEQILFGMGALWAAYGRATAKQPVALGKGAPVVLMLFVCLSTGCALKEVAQYPPQAQARYYAEQLATTYLDLSEGYRTAYSDLSSDQQKWAGENLKPLLNRAKHIVDMTLSAAKAWTIAVEKDPSVSSGSSDSETLAAIEADQARRQAARSKYERLKSEAEDLLEQAAKLYKSLKQGA